MLPSNRSHSRPRALRSVCALLATAGLLAGACGNSERALDPERLTLGPANVIAFGARDDDGGAPYGLYLVRSDGAGLEKLTEETGFTFFPRWSPDGSRLAYIVGSEGEERPGQLFVYDFATRTVTPVSDQALPSMLGPAASWSPDGTRLAFAEAVAGGRLRIFDVREGELEAPLDASGTAPDWSPTGDELVFTSPGAEAEVMRVESDGGDGEPLLARPGPEGNPRWSPDARLIAFWGAPADEPEARALLLLPRDGDGPIELGPGFAAAWSPEGERLAYARSARAEQPADLDIFLIPASGGTPERLTESVTVDSWPSWSPEGDQLAYLAQVDPQTAFLCLLRLDPPERNCLDLPGLVPAAPAWSPR